MSNSKKIWLGIFTFSPIIVTIIGIIGFFGAIATTFASIGFNNGKAVPFVLAGGFFSFIVLLLLAALADLLITIYFIADVLQDESVDIVEKVIWVLALFCISFFSTAVYWIVRIWNRKKGGLFNQNRKKEYIEIIEV